MGVPVTAHRWLPVSEQQARDISVRRLRMECASSRTILPAWQSKAETACTGVCTHLHCQSAVSPFIVMGHKSSDSLAVAFHVKYIEGLTTNVSLSTSTTLCALSEHPERRCRKSYLCQSTRNRGPTGDILFSFATCMSRKHTTYGRRKS